MCLSYNTKHTLSIHFLVYLHLNGNPFAHFLHMRDHAYFSSLHLQLLQCFHSRTQAFRIQRSEPFVYKKRLHLQIIAG